MKKTVLALSLAAMTLPALAQQKAAEPDYTVSGNFGLFSDYRFRGISQTDLKPALQGGFDFAHKSGFYAGTWASNVSDFANYGGGNGMEIDFYAGYKFPVGAFTLDVGNLYYYYPSSSVAPGDYKPNTNEIYLGISYGPATLKTSYATTKYFGGVNDDGESTKGTLYYDLSASFPLSDTLTLSAHVGYLDLKSLSASNTDYKIGLSKDLNGFALGAHVVGNSGEVRDSVKEYVANSGKTIDLGKTAVILSVSKTF